MRNHPAAVWFAENNLRAIAIVTSTEWPYRFAIAVDTQLVTADTIDSHAGMIVGALVVFCERQGARLRGSDYSTGQEAWEPLDLPASMNMAALRFDPRAVDAQQIRRDATAILFTLKRELERAQGGLQQ